MELPLRLGELRIDWLLLLILFFPGHTLGEEDRGLNLQEIEGVAQGGDNYALIVGVSDYSNGWHDIPSVSADVSVLEEVFGLHGFKVEVVVDPGSEELKRAFGDFVSKYGFRKDSRIVFVFLGHGHSRDSNTKGYLVPADAPLPSDDEEGFLRRSLSMVQINAWAKQMESQHVLFIFDSCFSGTIFQTRSTYEESRYIDDYFAEPVRQFITAGQADEKVPSKSIFTPLLIEALQGEGDIDEDGYITGTELGIFLHKGVRHVSNEQTPQWGKILDPDLNRGEFVFEVPEVSEESAGFDVGEYFREIESRRKWASYQERMHAGFRGAEKVSESDDLPDDRKRDLWRNFLAHFGEDNPWSEVDDELREKARIFMQSSRGQVAARSSDAVSASKPLLGANILKLDAVAASYLGLKEAKGILVTAVRHPAQSAGLRKDDVILKVDGIDVRENRDFIKYIMSKSPGDTIRLAYRRGLVESVLDVELAARDEEVSPQERGAEPALRSYYIANEKQIENSGYTGDCPGFRFHKLPGRARALGFEGVWVTWIDSEADVEGAQWPPKFSGFMIVAVNDVRISDVGDFEKFLPFRKGEPYRLGILTDYKGEGRPRGGELYFRCW